MPDIWRKLGFAISWAAEEEPGACSAEAVEQAWNKHQYRGLEKVDFNMRGREVLGRHGRFGSIEVGVNET